jgi:hypothetical protein
VERRQRRCHVTREEKRKTARRLRLRMTDIAKSIDGSDCSIAEIYAKGNMTVESINARNDAILKMKRLHIVLDHQI